MKKLYFLTALSYLLTSIFFKRTGIVLLCLLCFYCSCFAQSNDSVIRLNKIPPEGILLDKGWKFHSGDNIEWAEKNWDDTKWTNVQLSDYATYLLQLKNKNIGWFRSHLFIASSAQKKQLVIQLSQLGASEVYLNGKFFQRFGSVEMPLNYKNFNPVNKPFLLPFNIGDSIVIAIRFASRVPSNLWLFAIANKLPLTVTINYWNNALVTYQINSGRIESQTKFSYLFVALSFLFILLYIFFPRERINLLFGIFCFFAMTHSYFVYHLSQGSLDISQFGLASYFFNLNDAILGSLTISIACYAILNRIPFYYRLLLSAIGIDLLLILIFGPTRFQFIFDFIARVLTVIGFFHLSILAFIKKIYTIGTVAFISSMLNLTFFLFLFHVNLRNLNTVTLDDYVRYALTVNFIMTTIYVAINFASKSKNLEVQVVEIEKLSRENLVKEKEKQQLLASQNETLEKKVAERTAALQQSYNELKSTQAQLIQSEKMASLGELTAGIAHEIQNPLNFVNNFSEVNKELILELKQEIDMGNTEEVKAIANDIEENEQKINHHGKKADSIVKGMLEHSRASKGEKQLTDINALADEYSRLSYQAMRSKDKSFNAVINTHFDTSIGKINVVPQDIGRVLLNLFNNAFYAVQQKKQQLNDTYEPAVSVSTKKLDEKIEIHGQDNGNGIPQKIIDKIFQSFFTTKPTGEGTGLGLSLSYDIIKVHGGELKVNSVEGEGAEFIIELNVT